MKKNILFTTAIFTFFIALPVFAQLITDAGNGNSQPGKGSSLNTNSLGSNEQPLNSEAYLNSLQNSGGLYREGLGRTRSSVYEGPSGYEGHLGYQGKGDTPVGAYGNYSGSYQGPGRND